MKKFLTTLTAVLLSLSLCVGLAACGGGGGTHEGDHNTDDPYESTGEYHTVTFDSQGGSEVEAQTVLDGDYARQPSRPEKAGSYFLHWSEEIEGERFIFTSRIITKDITLYAVWGEAYTVTFDTQGGSDIPAQYVSPNTSARNPDSPTRSGYHFLGWYTQAEGGIEWKWNDLVTGNITVYAHWEADTATDATESLEFSFNSSLGGYVVTGVGQESDLRIPATYQNRPVVGIGNRAFYNKRISSVQLPASLVSIGTNAFTRTDLTSVTIPASVTTLGNYAFSECSSLTEVIFEAESQLESIGQRAFADDPALLELTIPANVTSIGNRLIYNSGVATIHFLGTRSAWDAIDKAENWNYGNTDVEVICSDDSSTSEPTEPTEPETFTVTFDSRDGSSVAAQEVEENGLVEEPDEPTKSNALFSYWETASGDIWRFNRDRVTGNMTLYAVWNDAYTITFDTQEGSDIPSQTVVAGTSARNPDPPTREEYNFLGWYTAAEGGIEWHWNDPVTRNITVYAHWEADTATNPTASLEYTYDTALNGYVVSGVGQESALRIPAEYNGTRGLRAVVGIGDRAFYNKQILSVELPASLVSIGTNAFTRTKITSVTIPANVTTLENYAFSQCSQLTTVTFAAGSQLESIGQRAFADDPALLELTIPAGVTSIGSRLIYNSGVATIHFLGTRAAWDAVAKEGWDTGKTDVTVTCADEEPAAILSDRKELA